MPAGEGPITAGRLRVASLSPQWTLRAATLASLPSGIAALSHTGLPAALAREFVFAARSDNACAPLHAPPPPGAARSASHSPLLASLNALLSISAWPHALSCTGSSELLASIRVGAAAALSQRSHGSGEV